VKVLLLGGGGREHAMAEAIRRWGGELVTVMANHNPGIQRLSANVKKANPTDLDAVRAFAKSEAVDLMVVGPEAALKAGVTDEVAGLGVRVASPSRMAARIETSKAYMRDLLERRKVPGTVEAHAFTQGGQARAFLEAVAYPVVVKPSGLTGGKGVQVEGKDFLEGDKKAAAAYAEEVLAKNLGGEGCVVIERRLDGEEFTLMAFCDGAAVKTMPIVQDHKRALEGDKGPNTGGMGSYSLADHSLPFLAPDEVALAKRVMGETAAALLADGCPFVGVLYGQFMATVDGPRVIEFNARFGDPEAMNVLPILETDYLRVCQAMADGTLGELEVAFARKATVCKYVVPRGYGTAQVAKGSTITVDEKAVARAGARLYFAMLDEVGGVLRTTTSRALAVVGVADRLQGAERAAEDALKAVGGDFYVRHDIGTQELVTKKVERMKGLRIKQARRGKGA
jgi:phosphoribosylamine---glycine ligase